MRELLLTMRSTFGSLVREGGSFSTTTIESVFRNGTNVRVALLGLLSQRGRRVGAHINISHTPAAVSACICAQHALTRFVGARFGISSLTFKRLGRRFVHSCRSFYLRGGGLTVRAIHRCLSVLGGVYHVTCGRKRSRGCRFYRFGLPGRGRAAPGTLDQRGFRGLHSLRVPRGHESRIVAQSLFLFTYCANATCTSTMDVAQRGLFASSRNDL